MGFDVDKGTKNINMTFEKLAQPLLEKGMDTVVQTLDMEQKKEEG